MVLRRAVRLGTGGHGKLAHASATGKSRLLIYGDSSALVKFVLDERESAALRASVAVDALITSSLAVTEMPRAVRREAASNASLRLVAKLVQAEIFLEELRIHPIEDSILRQGADLLEPHLRALDAIHVATALALRPLAAFVTYDKRQADAARTVGLPVRSPGA